MGFAFCKQVGDNEFETVQPLSPCKDYLNDVVYTEHTGRNFSAAGLTTTKQGIFENVPNAFIAIKMLNPKGAGKVYGAVFDLKQATELLQKNYKNIATLLNFVEEQFVPQGLTDRTTITETADKEMFLLSVPLWWCRTTHLISLYSLLVRMGQFWDGNGDANTFLENYDYPLDKALWKPDYGNSSYNGYKCMLKYGVHLITPQELYDRRPKGPNVHGNGIMHYE